MKLIKLSILFHYNKHLALCLEKSSYNLLFMHKVKSLRREYHCVKFIFSVVLNCISKMY
uniref:Uncharacterized protein n=1 Tax=Octopus bimaculoides TaxID=37653 RepID=A0A0L8FTP0_OCTBM